MLISPKNGFIFVHVYRTGGTTVREALTPYAPWELRGPWRRRLFSKLGRLIPVERWTRPGHHATAADIRDALPDGRFDDYFSFAFVRNPWSWNVSLYFYVRTTEGHRNHEFTRSLAGFTEFIEYRTDARRDLARRFYEYVTARPEHLRHEELSSFRDFEAYWEHRLRTGRELQKDFVTGGGDEVIVDFVGRNERLNEDLARVCRRIGLPAPDLPRRNETEHRPYREYYDDRTRRLVAEHFREDVRTFDYEF